MFVNPPTQHCWCRVWTNPMYEMLLSVPLIIRLIFQINIKPIIHKNKCLFYIPVITRISFQVCLMNTKFKSLRMLGWVYIMCINFLFVKTPGTNKLARVLWSPVCYGFLLGFKCIVQSRASLLSGARRAASHSSRPLLFIRMPQQQNLSYIRL